MRQHPPATRYWREIHAAWMADYKRFARIRGFRSFNDWPYHRRSFIECWAEPGFHRFWQVWNPGIAWFAYRLFLLLGGRKRWVWPTFATFVLNGLLHTLVVVPFTRTWSTTIIVTFACFGILTVASRYLARFLRQDTWPVIVNVTVNVLLVIASFDLGFRANRLLMAWAG